VALSFNQKPLYDLIDKILWDDWDPIGINDDAPSDEYQGYTPQIFNLKIQGANRETIAQCLYKIETEIIGVPGNIEHCRKVADKIVCAT